MKTFDRLFSSPHESRVGPVPKARRVFGVVDGQVRHAGWLMPSLPDSRQQPKSLAVRLREELNRRDAA